MRDIDAESGKKYETISLWKYQIKEHFKAPRRWPLWGELPSQRASNAENISIWWRHHVSASSSECTWGLGAMYALHHSDVMEWKRFFHYCSGSLEPEYSCHDRDWIMELPMEADILTFTGILTPENASVASCCSGSAGATVVAHGVALPLYRDCFLDLRLFNSPDLRRLVLCYCCQAWTLETVLGGNTALPRWWTARSIDADAKR